MEKSLTYMVEPQEDTWTPRFGGALLTGNILHILSHIDAGKVQHPDSMRKGKKMSDTYLDSALCASPLGQINSPSSTNDKR